MDFEKSYTCAVCKAKFNEDELCKHTVERLKKNPNFVTEEEFFVCCFDCCKSGKGRNIPT